MNYTFSGCFIHRCQRQPKNVDLIKNLKILGSIYSARKEAKSVDPAYRPTRTCTCVQSKQNPKATKVRLESIDQDPNAREG